MILNQLIQRFVSGPRPRFKKGDRVQCLDGSELMTIVWINISKKTNSIMYLCRWFDDRLQTKRTNLFFETQLRPMRP